MRAVLDLYAVSRPLDGQSFDKKQGKEGWRGRRWKAGRTQNSMDWERRMGV